jgi:hypothetical protein
MKKEETRDIGGQLCCCSLAVVHYSVALTPCSPSDLPSLGEVGVAWDIIVSISS